MSRAVSPLVNLRSTFLDSGAKICSRSLCSCLLSICASAAIKPSIAVFLVLTFIIRLNGACMHNGYLQYPRRSALPGFGVYSQAFGDVKSLFLGYPEKGDLCSGCQLTTFLQQLLSPLRGTPLNPFWSARMPAVHFFKTEYSKHLSCASHSTDDLAYSLSWPR